jgi:8-oxo-dGTP pyrophosphatase MutT (NUDIX family)
MPHVANHFAGVIILSPQNNFILQLRDDNPNIVDPGKLSIFAGRLQEGESPEDGARRELFEETSLKLDALEFFVAYEKDPARHGAPGVSYIYVAKNVDPTKLDVHEGQGWREVPPADLTEENTALISYDILKAYSQQMAD